MERGEKMKRRDVKAITAGALAQIASIAIMWNWTSLEDLEMAFLSFFAMGAGAAMEFWWMDKKKVSSKQIPKKHKPKIYTYTRGGRCLEGYYEQMKIG